ncbi:hypothetical protein HerbRD11066_48840 [Herbidospora sp. RD11066]
MIVGTILAVSLVTAGSAAGAAVPSSTRFTGEELFMGLFLTQGPAAEVYSDIRGPHSDAVWTSSEATTLTARMNALDPAFFAAFEADLTSGDRVRVKRAADRAGALAAKVATVQNGAAVSGEFGLSGSFIMVDRTIYKSTSVVVNKNKYWGERDAVSSELDRERWADDVADALAR